MTRKPVLDTSIHIPGDREQQLAEKRLFETSTMAAAPLASAMAYDGNLAMPHDVVKRSDGKFIIHVFRRPDIPVELGEQVVQMALSRIFGKPPEGTDLLYRDEGEIMRKEGLPRRVLESDSWYIELPYITSMLMPSVEHLRDKLARALQEIFLETRGA
jgi:hypothetical protein